MGTWKQWTWGEWGRGEVRKSLPIENHITLTSCTITRGHQQYYTHFLFTDLKSRLEVTCLTPRRAALGRSRLGNEMPIIGVCPRVTCFYPATHASPWAAAERGLLRMACQSRAQHASGSCHLCVSCTRSPCSHRWRAAEWRTGSPLFQPFWGSDGNRMRRWDHALSHCYVSRNFKMSIPISLKCTKLQIYSKAHLAEHITSVSFLWNRRIPLYYQYLHSSPNHYILIRSFLTVTLRFISIVCHRGSNSWFSYMAINSWFHPETHPAYCMGCTDE